MLEVYVDNIVQLAKSADLSVMRHYSRVAVQCIHIDFLPPAISKLLEGEGLWAVGKEILG